MKKQTIEYFSTDDFYEGIYNLSNYGIQFEATFSDLTIRLI